MAKFDLMVQLYRVTTREDRRQSTAFSVRRTRESELVRIRGGAVGVMVLRSGVDTLSRNKSPLRQPKPVSEDRREGGIFALNIRKERFFNAYIVSGTVEEAAKIAGVGRSTGYKYLHEKDFDEALAEHRKEMAKSATSYLTGKMRMCAETLIDIVQSEETPANVKVQAIQAVFGNVGKLIDQIDIMRRIDALEAEKDGF